MIDWSRVEELVEEIGAEDFGEVVELFLDEVESAIVAFEGAAGDPTTVEEQMHFLKGASLNLGFESLAQLCLKGERAASSGQVAVVAPAEVRQVFDASRTQFLEGLPARLAA